MKSPAAYMRGMSRVFGADITIRKNVGYIAIQQ